MVYSSLCHIFKLILFIHQRHGYRWVSECGIDVLCLQLFFAAMLKRKGFFFLVVSCLEKSCVFTLYIRYGDPLHTV